MKHLRRAGLVASLVVGFGLATAARAGTCGAGIVCNVQSWSQNGTDVDFVLEDGNRLRLSVLADDLIRVRFAPSGGIVNNVSQAVVKTNWTASAFTVAQDAHSVSVITAEMVVVVRRSPCVVECFDRNGNLIVGDDPARRMQWSGSETRVYKTTQPGESYLGLGWRTLGLRRNGSRFIMRNVPNYGSTDTFYGGVPLWYGLRDGQAYAIFFDDTSWGEINVGQASSSYMFFRNLGGQVDYYVLWGPSMGKILNRYTELTGRPFLPPKWACGYQQCRWSYTPRSEVLAIAGELRARSIPCDVMYLDIDYMNKGWALTFNPVTFPDPAGLCANLHNQGFHVVANISPFLFADDPKRPAAEANNHVLRKADGSLLWGWHDYWYFVGGASTGSMLWLDFSKTAARDWWRAQHAGFLAYGIDGIWNDLNEPDELGGAWPTDVKYSFDGSPVNHNKTATQYCLLETTSSYQALLDHAPHRRPFVLSRGAYAGMQRVSAVWSGDNTADWTNDMKRNIPMGSSMSISGQPCNGHDIGGFFGAPTMDDPPNAELYARWMQWGVFTAFCRQHHDGFGNRANPPRPYAEPWRFGASVETICRNYINLRYRLMPYLYSLFYQAHVTGAPIHRPTVYDFPADPNTLTQDYDFLFGPCLLISPVYTAGATTRSVYLPSGADWIDWWDDTLRTGGTTVSVPAPLDRLPIHVRKGAILPMGPTMQYAGQTAMTELTLEIYPDTTDSSFTLFEDDGETFEYQSGSFATTDYTTRQSGTTFTLQIAARAGSFAPAARHYMARVHRWHSPVNTADVSGVALPRFTNKAQLDASPRGYFHDTVLDILYARFEDTGSAMTLTASDAAPPDADFDADGDVDLADFALFQLCFAGPNRVPGANCLVAADMDGDADVDLSDFGLFQSCFNGPNRPPACR